MESYILRVECLDKALRLGVHTDAIDAVAVLTAIHRDCRRIGLLRVASQRHNYRMPFRSLRPRSALTVRHAMPVFEYDKYLTSLLDQSIGRRRIDEVRAVCTDLEIEFAAVPDEELIHGKDALEFIAAVLTHCGAPRDSGPGMLWTAFDRASVAGYASLTAVIDFLTDQRSATRRQASSTTTNA